MIVHTVAAIRREFNRRPVEAIQHAVDKLRQPEKLSHSAQMDLAGLFTRASAQGLYQGISAAECVLENIASVSRDDSTLAPDLYRLLLSVIGNASRDQEWASMNYRSRAILKANLTEAEKTELVDSIVGGKDLQRTIEAAGEVLKGASEFRVSLRDAKKIADVLRRGLASEITRDREGALTKILEALRYSEMRGSHAVILEDLAKDAGEAVRSGNVSTQYIDEDNRAFLHRVLALTADGPF